jgi:hypothetical protein
MSVASVIALPLLVLLSPGALRLAVTMLAFCLFVHCCSGS